MATPEVVHPSLAIVCDRGGHLHDALMLLRQMNCVPSTLVTTFGPDVDAIQKEPRFLNTKFLSVPQAFTWFGKKRVFNPLKAVYQVILSLWYVLKSRPTYVISTGAANIVFFCYFAKWMGAKICHVENLAQVRNPSVTGRLLYPISDLFYVQWEDLLSRYGEKAQYRGWVL